MADYNSQFQDTTEHLKYCRECRRQGKMYVADNRALTEYRQTCNIDNILRVRNNIQNNYDYKQFLINNADKIIDSNRSYHNNMAYKGCR